LGSTQKLLQFSSPLERYGWSNHLKFNRKIE